MEQNLTIALFGEAEKGEYEKGHYFTNIPQLVESLGHPPPESQGLHYAVQTLLYEHYLIFFRVREEGFSHEDYFMGMHFIHSNQLTPNLTGICIPGAGDAAIIDSIAPYCKDHNLVLLITEPDLYDYLTTAQS